MTIKDRILLNKVEFYNLLMEYLDSVVNALNNHYYNKNEIKELINELLAYKKEIKYENSLLEYINKNINDINIDELDKVIDMIDSQNELTYKYYQSVGESYEAKSFPYAPLIYPSRRTKRIMDNYDLIDEVKGLTLSLDDISNYFGNSEAYNYTVSRSKIVPTSDVSFFGLCADINEEILSGYRIIVPPIINLNTALINVHEIKCGIDLYPYLNDSYPLNNNFEVEAKNEEQKFRKEYVRNK